MFCPICGSKLDDGAAVCPSCGNVVNNAAAAVPQAAAIAQPAYSQDLAAAGAAMYDYCKVDMSPKPAKGVLIFISVLAVLLLLMGLAAGVYPFIIVAIILEAIGVIAVYGGYKISQKNSQRLANIFSRDGEQFVLSEFASAQPMANDQFRLSTYYVFVKKKAVIRTVSIGRITRVTESTNFIPTGVRLDALVSDEMGDMNITLCRLHLGKSKNEADELFNEIMARRQYAIEQSSQGR